MAYDTEAEILELVKDRESELGPLYDRMDKHFDLFALTAYEPKDSKGNVRAGYQSYTSSEPRNFFDKVLDGLNNAAVTIQIQLPADASVEDRRKASQGELFLFGALNAIDERLLRRGEPPLREGLGHLMCLRGWYGMRVLVYTPEKGGDTAFDAAPWDSLHMTWEMGRDGPLWVAFKRRATRAQIQSEYGKDLGASVKDVEIIDWFDEKDNCVIVGNEFAKKKTPHNIGHVPALIRAVGSMPTIQKRSFESTIEYQGDSVWSASANLYEPQNKYISSLFDNQQRSVTGSIVHQSKTGQKKLDSDPYESWQEILVEEGETITQLELQHAPPETAAILDRVSRDIQQGTLPYPIAYGGTQQAMSGRAMSILADATRSVYSPRTSAMAQAYSWLCKELLVQFKAKGKKPVSFQGYRPGMKPSKESFYSVELDPDDINPDWFLNVRVEPRMPRDEQAAVAMALALTRKNAPDDIPLMSKSTVREEKLLLQDPDAEEDKVLFEMGQALPPIIAAKIAKATKDAGDEEGAEMIMRLLRPPQAKAVANLPPELIKAVAEALLASGQDQLAGIFVQAVAQQMGPAPATGNGAVAEAPTTEALPEDAANATPPAMGQVGTSMAAAPPVAGA